MSINTPTFAKKIGEWTQRSTKAEAKIPLIGIAEAILGDGSNINRDNVQNNQTQISNADRNPNTAGPAENLSENAAKIANKKEDSEEPVYSAFDFLFCVSCYGVAHLHEVPFKAF